MPLCTNNIYFEGGGGAGGGLGSGRWIGGQSFRSVDGVGTFTLVPDDVVLRILASAKERVSFLENLFLIQKVGSHPLKGELASQWHLRYTYFPKAPHISWLGGSIVYAR